MAEQRFGRYELRSLLGKGGFAQVFRAYDPALHREIALKTLLPALVSEEEIRRRFSAEAQALAGLHHPNIVTVYDVGETERVPFFAMELIEGRTLAQLVAEEGPQPLARVVAWVRALGSAVGYLHRAGIVHRDIKPANVMVESSGRPVLMDFGIAHTPDGTLQTQSGISMGTPAYMAPEQVRGERVGPAADVYALGTLAYHLLAGRPPFQGDTAYVLHAQVYDPPPPLATLRPDLPQAVFDALLLALAKDPVQRPNAETLAGLLEGDQTRTQSITPPSGRTATIVTPPTPPPSTGMSRGHGRSLLLAASAAVIVVLVIAGLAITQLGAHGGHGIVSGSPTGTRGATAASSSGPGSAPTFTASFASADDGSAWAAGHAPWNATVAFEDAPAGAALQLRIVAGSNPGAVVMQSAVAPLNASGGSVQLSVPPPAAPMPAGNYLAQLYLVQGANSTLAGSRSFAVIVSNQQATQAGTRAATQSASQAATRPPTQQASQVATRPPATQPPTQPPATQPPTQTGSGGLRAGNWARIAISGDCLNLHSTPGSNTPLVDCPYDGSDAELLDGPQQADGANWWHVRIHIGGAVETGYASAQYLSPSSAPVALNVTGTYTLRDYGAYGQGTNTENDWAVTLSQSGTHITGQAVLASDGKTKLTLDGDIIARVLHLRFTAAQDTGEYWWSFTPDGAHFQGAFGAVAGGSDVTGGTSYGARQGASGSAPAQASIFVVGANAPNGVVARGQTVYVCYTISSAADVTVTHQPSTAIANYHDDGTGDCRAVTVSPDADGQARFSIVMAQNGTNLAGSNAIVSVH